MSALNKLTATDIKTAKAGQQLADGGGLYVRVRPNSKTWIFQYRAKGSTSQRKLTLGNYPDMSMDEARTLRGEYKAMIARGEDPGAVIDQRIEKREADKRNTLENITAEWLKKKSLEVSAEHLIDIENMLKANLLEALGEKPIASLTPVNVTPVLDIVANRGALSVLSKVIRYLNQIINFAVNRGIVPANPFTAISDVYHKPKQEHFAAVSLADFPLFLRDFNRAQMDRKTAYLFRFQLLTMVRPSEAVRARWSDIDFDENTWTIPAEFMKGREGYKRPFIVPLSKQVIELLHEVKAFTGHREFVFPGDRDPRGHMHKETVSRVIQRMPGYKGRMTAHGFRSIAVTALIDIKGEDQKVADYCLAHKSGKDKGAKTWAAYYRDTMVPRRAIAVQWWADYVTDCEADGIAGKKSNKRLRAI